MVYFYTRFVYVIYRIIDYNFLKESLILKAKIGPQIRDSEWRQHCKTG